MQASQIIVIGGGAAGFMAAITAAESFPAAKVTILEKNRTVLSKVRISGGGRCNVTNAASSIAELLKGYPRGNKFLRPLFEKFNNQDTIKWFESRGVTLKTEPDGRVFPTTDDSQTIISCLIGAAQQAGVNIHTSSNVTAIAVLIDKFQLILQNGDMLVADKVVVTTGGYPQLSSYEWLASHQIQIVPPVPSLFTFNAPQSPLQDLMGVAVTNATAKVAGTKLAESGAMLITHWGMSGPAILKLSAWGARELAEKNYKITALINWLNLKPAQLAEQITQYQKDIQWRAKFVVTASPFEIPLRLWRRMVEIAHIPDTMRWADIPAKNTNRLVEQLTNFALEINGKTIFKEEFVTCGGVALGDVRADTLESKQVPNLYFAGEVLDIDGITGGYNFQAAWTTGYIVGKNLS